MGGHLYQPFLEEKELGGRRTYLVVVGFIHLRTVVVPAVVSVSTPIPAVSISISRTVLVRIVAGLSVVPPFVPLLVFALDELAGSFAPRAGPFKALEVLELVTRMED